MPTIQEVLRQTGLTDEQIAALDTKVVQGFTTILSTAEQKEAAAQQAQATVELNQRKINDYMANEVTPALNNWANEKTTYEAKLAAYSKAFEEAKSSGFVPPDFVIGSPTSDGQPARNAQGQFVAGQNAVPGSPAFDVNRFRSDAGAFMGTMLDLQHKYQALFGTIMPDSPTALIREAADQHMDPVTYAAKKYNFAGREQEVATKKQQDLEAKIRADAIAERDRYHAERTANPALRQAEASAFSDIRKAVNDKSRPDPLMQTKEERHRTTLENIGRDIAEKAQVQ